MGCGLRSRRMNEYPLPFVVQDQIAKLVATLDFASIAAPKPPL